MCVLQRLLQGLQSPTVVRLYWVILAVTFIISFIVTFVECHPFRLYWQVVPDPGTKDL
jgi:energy-converting hydrogenase Eha subunit F